MRSVRQPTGGPGEPAPRRTPTPGTALPKQRRVGCSWLPHGWLLSPWLLSTRLFSARLFDTWLTCCPGPAGHAFRARAAHPAATCPHLPHQLLVLPHSAPQGDAKEGLGRAQAKGEDLAGDASKAAKDAADQLKP